MNEGQARAILQNWVDSHPFQLGSEIEPQYEEPLIYGRECFRFYLSITRFGLVEIFVDRETGELFYNFRAPDNNSWFEPIDDWYYREHADYAQEPVG